MAERQVKITRTSSGTWEEEATISSLEDLEAIIAKYVHYLIIMPGDDGKLSGIEIYDDYRE